MPDHPETEATSAVATTSPSPPAGRLAVMTAYAVAASAIPIPFVPDRVIESVRGAMIHDVASRHGVSLTADARSMLASPASEQRTRLVRAAEGLVRTLLRRVRGLGLVSSASRALEAYALGLLFERYLTDVRPTGAVRMQVEEARRVRDGIDRAVIRAFSPSLKPKAALLPAGADDLRDEFTRWVDALLLTGATLPAYVQRRLEAAFDEIVAETPGIRGG